MVLWQRYMGTVEVSFVAALSTKRRKRKYPKIYNNQ